MFNKIRSEIENRTFGGNKIYFVNELNENMLEYRNSKIFKSIKAINRLEEAITLKTLPLC